MIKLRKYLQFLMRLIISTMILTLFNIIIAQALNGDSLPDISKSDDGLEIIRIEAKNITGRGFTLEFTVNDQAVNKNARLTYAYTIYEGLIIKNYNIGYSNIIPTTKTEPLSNLNRIWADKNKNVYSVDIEEIMPQNFYIYAMLSTPDGETDVISCELVAEKEMVYTVLYPYNWFTPTPTPTPTPVPIYMSAIAPTQLMTTALPVYPTIPPEPWPGPQVVKKFAEGFSHSLLVSESNKLWTWGNNSNGQLGDGTNTDRITPVLVMSGIADVAPGLNYTLAVKQNGELWGWGANSNYQLGLGSRDNKSTPHKIMDNVVMAAAGSDRSLALTQTGDVYTWGLFYDGQSASGEKYYQATPIKVLDNVRFIACGVDFSYAIKTNGDLFMWGNEKQILDGTNSPEKLAGGVKLVSAGWDNAMILMETGELYGIGSDYFGQMGGAVGPLDVMKKIPGMDNVKDVCVGEYHVLAQKSNGEIWVWGLNESGQLGLGNTDNQEVPVRLMTAEITNNVIAMSAGRNQSHVQLSNRELYGFGDNSKGQLGDGTTTSHSRPVKVIFSASGQ